MPQLFHIRIARSSQNKPAAFRSEAAQVCHLSGRKYAHIREYKCFAGKIGDGSRRDNLELNMLPQQQQENSAIVPHKFRIEISSGIGEIHPNAAERLSRRIERFLILFDPGKDLLSRGEVV